MAVESIDAHLITQFSDQVHVKAQQMQARLRPFVEIRKMDGDKYMYDGLGDVEVVELLGRHNEIQWNDIEHTRRQIDKHRYAIALPIDRNDVEGMLLDPQNLYVPAIIKAMERQFDRLVIGAIGASVKTGRTGATTVTASTDGVLTVNATAGLTLAKLLEIRQNFIDNEVGNDTPADIVVGISGDEHTTLQQIAQLTSRDYSTQFSLEKGVIDMAVGMKLIPFGASATTPMLAVSGGVRTSFAMARGGVCMAIARNMEVKIQERNDYFDTTQVLITAVMGAVRTEGKLCQLLTTTDL